MIPDQHNDDHLNNPGFQSLLVECLEKLEASRLTPTICSKCSQYIEPTLGRGAGETLTIELHQQKKQSQINHQNGTLQFQRVMP